jgi:MFS family permease
LTQDQRPLLREPDFLKFWVGQSSAVYVLLFVGRVGISPAQIGLVAGAASLSSLLGTQVIRPLQRRAGVGPVMVLAAVLYGTGTLGSAAAAFVPRPAVLPLLVSGGLVTGFGLMSYNVLQQAIRQTVVADRLLGRTTAGLFLVTASGSVAASLLGGAAGQLLGLRPTLVAAAVIFASSALPTALSSLRSLRELPKAS